MLDYCLLLCLFSNNINTYKFYGESFIIHSKINELINYKQIQESDNPDLVFINNESYSFIDYYWKNILTDNVKWLLITINNKQQTEILFKEIRNFAENSLLLNDVIILNNIKSDFQSFFRQNFILPAKKNLNLDIENFFNFQIEKTTLDLKQIFDKDDILLAKLMTNTTQYVYYGQKITDDDFNKCKMLLNMKFNILLCEQNNQTIGWFCKKDLIKDLLIYQYTNSKIMENILKFNVQKLNIPVNRI